MRQTPAQSLGRKGERWFQNALPKEWIFQRPSEDFGLDGTVAIATPDAITGLEFGVQIKSSRSWAKKSGVIQVSGIPTRTLTYWMARLVPTMLVLYDEAEEAGYYAWIPEALDDLPSALQSKRHSVTLKASQNAVLNKEAWESIEAWARRDHRRLTEAVSSSAIAAALLNTIHELSTSIRLLQVLENAQAKDDDAEMLRDASDLTSHKTVYIALRTLASKLAPDAPLKMQLEQAAAAYVAEVEAFIGSAGAAFERAFQSDYTMAVWANQELMDASRPRMIFLIADYLCKLSSLSSSPK